MALDPNKPLRVTTAKWHEKIRLGKQFKKKNFDRYAEEGMAFYTGYDAGKTWKKYMVDPQTGGNISDDEAIPETKFQFMTNRVAELVQIYGPMLYHRNPVRTVTPRKLAEIPQELYEDMVPPAQPPPNAPPEMVQQLEQQRQQMIQQLYQQAAGNQNRYAKLARARAELMSCYLNYTPNELNLKKHSRNAIDEGLIKGAGVLWHHTTQRYPGGPTLVGSFYDTIDNLVIDPDAETFEDAEWIARRRRRPVWRVAEEYKLNEAYLRKHAQAGSFDQESDRIVDYEFGEAEYDDYREERSNDILEYWEIYSKMGMGDRLSGIPKEQRDTLREFGDNVYMVVAKGIDFPLNLPERLLVEAAEDEEAFEEAFERVQWPIPYWIDGSWPMTPISFHFIPGSVWPLSHIRPGLPELKFNNWTMSFLADQSRETSRMFLGYLASLDDEIQEQIESGGALTRIKIPSMDGKQVSDMVSFLSPPNNSTQDLWNINEKIEQNFDKRTGLDETMYVQPGGMRSATEAQMKSEARNIRPDDMANRVEDWMSEVARKEALACQWLLEVEDVADVLGPEGAKLWEMLVMTADPAEMALEFDYRIEAGSTRKPNKAQKIENMQNALQTFPNIWQIGLQMPNVEPVNALVRDWAKANDIENVDRYLMPPPDPAAMQRQQQMQEQQMQMEQQKLQLESAKLQADLQGKTIDAQAKQMEFQFQQQESQLDLAKSQQDMVQDQRQHEQELVQDQQEHAQEMAQEREKSSLQMTLERMLGMAKLDLAEKQGEAKIKQMRAQAAAKPKPKTSQGA